MRLGKERYLASCVLITLMVVLILCFCSVENAHAAETARGRCGEKLTWSLDDQGTLTISGTGKMYDYYLPDERYAPWCEEHQYDIFNVVIEKGVTSIGDSAFSHCEGLQSITIPEGVKTIGSEAFLDCYNLLEVTFPDGVTSIGINAFYNCTSLKSVYLPGSITSIESYAFFNCGLQQVSIPYSMTVVESGVFDDCEQLTRVYLPDTLTTIGPNAFNCCPIREIDLPDMLKEIGDYAFHATDLTSIKLPNSLEIIGDSAFSRTGITSLTIPYSVKKMSDSSFDFCDLGTDLKEIYCYEGTIAEKILSANGVPFISLGPAPDQPGTDPDDPSGHIKRSLLDTYSFGNYRVPKFSHQTIIAALGDDIGKTMSMGLLKMLGLYSGKNGVCFGFALTAAASAEYNAPQAYSYEVGLRRASRLSDVMKSSKSTSTQLTADQLIQIGHVFQTSDSNQQQRDENENDYQGLYDAVYSYTFGDGDPVIIGVNRAEGGHALWALGLGSVDEDSASIQVYDCNHPKEECYLTLDKDGNGDFCSAHYEGETVTVSYVTPVQRFAEDVVEGRIGGYSDVYTTLDLDKDLFSFSNTSMRIKTGSDVYTVNDAQNSGLLQDIQLWADQDDQTDSPSHYYWGYPEEDFSIETGDQASSFSIYDNYGAVSVAAPARASANVQIGNDKDPAVKLDMEEKGDYSISLMYDSSSDLDEEDEDAKVTFTSVEGSDAASVNFGLSEEGMIVSSDNLKGAVIRTGVQKEDADDEYHAVQISTEEEKVKIDSTDGEIVVYSDADGDGEYSDEVEATDVTPETSKSLNYATVKLSRSSYTYDGKYKKPGVQVSLLGRTLTQGKDYTVSYSKNKYAGTASVTVTGTGRFIGSAKKTFKINKAANLLRAQGKTVVLKAKTLRKKAQVRTVSKTIKFTRRGQGKLTYKLARVTKAKFKKYFSVNAKTGTLTVKKKLKRGTYKVRVNVTAAGTANYSKATKAVTITVKVK